MAVVVVSGGAGESHNYSSLSTGSSSPPSDVSFSPVVEDFSSQNFMPRLLAVKAPIQDLINGVPVQRDGMEFTVTPIGEWVSRAHVMGVVIDSFPSGGEGGGGNYASLTLDDASGSFIRLKSWDESTSARIRRMNVGSIVDVIGRVRRYQNETYMVPEIVREVNDARLRELRRLELLDKRNAIKAAGGKVLELLNDEFAEDPVGLMTHASERLGLPKDLVEGIMAFHYESRRMNELRANAIEGKEVTEAETAASPTSLKRDAMEVLKKKILGLLESKSQTGIEYSQFSTLLPDIPSGEIDEALETLSDEGEIFEPRGGIFKRLI